MYRDTASALDEHDRAVGAILIGEALVDTCEEAGSPLEPHDRWRAFAGPLAIELPPTVGAIADWLACQGLPSATADGATAAAPARAA